MIAAANAKPPVHSMPSNRNPALLTNHVSAAALKLDEPPAGQPAARPRALSQRRVELGAKSLLAAGALVATGVILLAVTVFRMIRQDLAAGRATDHVWTDADSALISRQEIAGFTPWSPEALGSLGEYYSGGTFVGDLAEDWSGQAAGAFPAPSAPEPLAKAAGRESVARLGPERNAVALTLP